LSWIFNKLIMKNPLTYISLVLLFCGCQNKMDSTKVETWKKEVFDTEIAFSAMAESDGIAHAFLHFASEDAVLLRNSQLIKGKVSIQNWFETNKAAYDQSKLSWKPDFVEVSSSGDLGYTYGKYVYTSRDSLGNTESSEGIFHTVWKKQTDGTWRFVWD